MDPIKKTLVIAKHTIYRKDTEIFSHIPWIHKSEEECLKHLREDSLNYLN